MIRPTSAAEDRDPRLDLDDASLDEASDHAYPIVAQQLARREGATLMLGISIALLLGAATLFGMTVSRAKAPNATAASAPVDPAPGLNQPGAPMPAPPPAVGAANPAAAGVAPTPAAVPAAMPGAIAVPPAAFLNGSEAARAPALVYDALSTQPSVQSNVVAGQPAEAPRAASATAQGLTADEQFAQRIATDAGSARAGRMEMPRATVAQGTLIAAVLETALNSDLPGYVRAVISRDVRSFDGSSILIPRGARVIGEYKSGLAVGQTRAFILWTRLIRPDGVSIALASPATDAAGSNGVSGKVDTHFGKRFGAAILLSLISASGQAIGGGSGTLVIAGPAQAASSVAQRDINIPPTVRVPAGQPIRIFVARDLDFSGVSLGK